MNTENFQYRYQNLSKTPSFDTKISGNFQYKHQKLLPEVW